MSQHTEKQVTGMSLAEAIPILNRHVAQQLFSVRTAWETVTVALLPAADAEPSTHDRCAALAASERTEALRVAAVRAERYLSMVVANMESRPSAPSSADYYGVREERDALRAALGVQQ